MKNLSLTFCLAIATLLASVGSGLALPSCPGSPSNSRGVKDSWTNCTGTFGSNTQWAGDKYVGEYKDNKFHGKSTYFFAIGGIYVGEWRAQTIKNRG